MESHLGLSVWIVEFEPVASALAWRHGFQCALWCVPPRVLGPGENTLRFIGKRVGEQS